MRSARLLSAILALLLVTAAGASPLPAGLISFRRVPIPDEVPAHLCTALAQDREGFLWMGTQDGLVRFDGYSFRVHRSDPGDPRTLGGSYAGIAAHELRLDDGTVLERTCSIGFAAWPFAPERPRAIGWEEIVDLADLALYAAKRSGRNRWVGIEAGEAEDPAAAVKRFREDPESSLAGREVRVHARGADLRWA